MALKTTMKNVYLAIGWFSFALGIIGLLLPIMPTTPFLIVTAYCFSKGSDRLYNWLLTRPIFGPRIEEWQEHGVIRNESKIFATLVLSFSFGMTLIFAEISVWIKVTMVTVGVGILVFVWTRPSQKVSSKANQSNLD